MSTRKHTMYIVAKLGRCKYVRKEYRKGPTGSKYSVPDLTKRLHDLLGLPSSSLYQVNGDVLERLISPETCCKKHEPNCAYAQIISGRILEMLSADQPEYSLTGAEVTAAVYNTH
jgi:hypothetical protein